MAQVIEFPRPYYPSIEAAVFERAQATAERDAIANMPVDEWGDCVPAAHLERYRAAQERFYAAMSYTHEAHMAELGRKLDAIWR